MRARTAALLAAFLLAAIAAATGLYYRHLASQLLEDRPLAIETGPPGDVRAARSGAELRIGEADLGRLLFAGRMARVRLAEPYARIAFSQRDEGSGRWLNAELLVAFHAAPEGLGVRVLSGRVGGVSISGTEGEWVRTKIERQLSWELSRNERARALFAGAREIRVEADALVARFPSP